MLLDILTIIAGVQTNFKKDLKEIITELKVAQDEVKVILEKKSLITLIGKKFRKNPFVLESFQEATEKLVTHAKAEVEAFTTNCIVAAGIDAIKNKNQLSESTEVPALKSPESND